ncbi:MAG TPA: DUF2293 domain-containing protein [Trichocoleus sp.]
MTQNRIHLVDAPEWFYDRRLPSPVNPPTYLREMVQLGKLTNDDVTPKPPPKPFWILGSQGLLVINSIINHPATPTSERMMSVIIAPPKPFSEPVMKLAKRAIAYWDSIFNTWRIPIRNHNRATAIAWAQEAFYEVDWEDAPILLSWAARGETVANNLLARWSVGKSVDAPCLRPLVRLGLSRSALIEEALTAYNQRAAKPLNCDRMSRKEVERVLLAHVRHNHTDYHNMLWWERRYRRLEDADVERIRNMVNAEIVSLYGEC